MKKCMCSHRPIFCINSHTYAQQHFVSRCLRGHAVKGWFNVPPLMIIRNYNFPTYEFCTYNDLTRGLSSFFFFFFYLLRAFFLYLTYVVMWVQVCKNLSRHCMCWQDVTWLDSPVSVVIMCKIVKDLVTKFSTIDTKS